MPRVDANRLDAVGYVADTISFSSVDGPGNRFVVFMQGCNFDCVACHNPQTIPGHAPLEGHQPRHRRVDDLLEEIRAAAPFIRGVTASGGEATRQARFVRALFHAIKNDTALAHLGCLIDSNGAADAEVWHELAPVIDGAMIDLKCLDADIHREMTGQPNDQVLASIEHLASRGLLYEVRLLLLAGVNDADDLLVRTGRWLATNDPEMRVKLIGFRRHGTRPHAPALVEPTPEALTHAAAVLRTVAPFDVCVI